MSSFINLKIQVIRIKVKNRYFKSIFKLGYKTE